MCLPEQSARDAALAELAGLDPAALDAATLMTQITELATFISQALTRRRPDRLAPCRAATAPCRAATAA